MNLDDLILILLKDNKGRVSKGKMWERFSNYSRGYLHERLQALRYSGYIKEDGGWYILTKKGEKIRVDTTT